MTKRAIAFDQILAANDIDVETLRSDTVDPAKTIVIMKIDDVRFSRETVDKIRAAWMQTVIATPFEHARVLIIPKSIDVQMLTAP